MNNFIFGTIRQRHWRRMRCGICFTTEEANKLRRHVTYFPCRCTIAQLHMFYEWNMWMIEHTQCSYLHCLYNPYNDNKRLKVRFMLAFFKTPVQKNGRISNRTSAREKERLRETETDSAICRKWIGFLDGRDLAAMPIFREICFYLLVFSFSRVHKSNLKCKQPHRFAAAAPIFGGELWQKGKHINFHFTVQQ